MSIKQVPADWENNFKKVSEGLMVDWLEGDDEELSYGSLLQQPNPSDFNHTCRTGVSIMLTLSLRSVFLCHLALLARRSLCCSEQEEYTSWLHV
jgi:hypothetical protein